MTKLPLKRATSVTFIDSIVSTGKYWFSFKEAIQKLGKSPIAVEAILRRLKQKGLIASPIHRFFVIVPPEYRSFGCLPADQFIPALMRHLQEPYYAGLLTAASYHGAAHQAPQVFQVMVSGKRRSITCHGIRINFITNQNVSSVPTLQRNTQTDSLILSTPEATAYDLVKYYSRAAGFDHVATVLVELSEAIDPKNFQQLSQFEIETPILQRLGYLFEFLKKKKHANAIFKLLKTQHPYWTYLNPSSKKISNVKNNRWKLYVNQEVDPDI